jgi:hypothetical protein
VGFESFQSESPVSSRSYISSGGIRETQFFMGPTYWFRYWRGLKSWQFTWCHNCFFAKSARRSKMQRIQP